MSNAKNVEAFARLVGFCTGFGGSYNPGQQNLRTASLSTLLTNARTALLNVHTAKTEYEVATNNREILFRQVEHLVGRVLAELRSSGAQEQTIADAQAAVHKITGYRYSKEPEKESDPPDGQPKGSTRRARGLDFGTMVHNMEKLVQTVAAEPLYLPMIPVLTVTGLQTTVESMRQANERVVQATVLLMNAREVRNQLFYGEQNSVCAIAKAVKYKVKAIFGFHSEAYQNVRSVVFIKR